MDFHCQIFTGVPGSPIVKEGGSFEAWTGNIIAARSTYKDECSKLPSRESSSHSSITTTSSPFLTERIHTCWVDGLGHFGLVIICGPKSIFTGAGDSSSFQNGSKGLSGKLPS